MHFEQKIAVTIPGAMAASGLGRTFFYERFKDGTLTPRKAGKRTLILVSELREFLESLPKAA